MVSIGDYGMKMTLVLAGTCRVIPGPTDGSEPFEISSHDREPAYGLQSALPKVHWTH
eukprot:COSAG05_NODE_21218_length_273_cov_1.172414_1_plen_56_part_10